MPPVLRTLGFLDYYSEMENLNYYQSNNILYQTVSASVGGGNILGKIRKEPSVSKS